MPLQQGEHNRLLQALIDRPRGSIEYKHQDISAVLKELGEDWIPGYKPAFNFQASLIDAVVRWLDRHPDWLAPAVRMAMGLSPSALRKEAMLWIGPPPTHSNAPPPVRRNDIHQHSDTAQSTATVRENERPRKWSGAKSSGQSVFWLVDRALVDDIAHIVSDACKSL